MTTLSVALEGVRRYSNRDSIHLDTLSDNLVILEARFRYPCGTLFALNLRIERRALTEAREESTTRFVADRIARHLTELSRGKLCPECGVRHPPATADIEELERAIRELS